MRGTGNNGHFYNGKGTLDRKGAYARVSSILAVRDKPELNNWKIAIGAEEAERKSEEARLRGTAIHDAIETYIKYGDTVLLPEDYAPFFNGFMNWWNLVQPTDCVNELPLRHRYYKYAGRCDLVCSIEGFHGRERWLVDFKTSKRFDPGMGLQLAAYKKAYYAMTGHTVRTGILQITNQTKKGYRWKEYDEPFGVFKAHLDIFRWLEKQKRPVEDSTWDGRTLVMTGANQ